MSVFGKTQRVLLVEDHPEVRRMVRLLIEQLGHEVVREVDGCASALAPEPGPPLDTALVDVLLPDGNGVELGLRLLTLHPGIRVVLMSSRSAEDLGPAILDPRFTAFIAKIDLSERTLAEVLR